MVFALSSSEAASAEDYVESRAQVSMHLILLVLINGLLYATGQHLFPPPEDQYHPPETGSMFLMFLGNVAILLFLNHRHRGMYALRYPLVACINSVMIFALAVMSVCDCVTFEQIGFLFGIGEAKVYGRR